jgi:hypothetical protein
VELVEGWYSGSGLPGDFDEGFVPPGWLTPESFAEGGVPVYEDVVAKSCRACHIMQTDRLPALDFASYDEFAAIRETIRSAVYDEGYMPMAKRTFDKFWGEGGPSQAEELAKWVDEPGRFETPTYLGIPIPDFGEGGPLEINLLVDTDVTEITDLDISFDGLGPFNRTEGNSLNGLTHSYVGDLQITLTSPANTSVMIMDRIGGSGNNIGGLRLDDDVGISIDSATSAQAPFIGSWKPSNPLSAFNGENPNGTWRLSVLDQAALDTGTVQQYTLHFNSVGMTSGPGKPKAVFSVNPGLTPDYQDLITLDAGSSLFADSITWLLSRPAGSLAVLSNTDQPTTSFTADVEGSFTVTLTIENAFGKSTSQKDIVVANKAPVVSVAAPLPVEFPLPLSLDATATDDGLPDSPSQLTYQWDQVSGPGDVTFETPASEDSVARFSAPGVYQLSLTVSDGALQTTQFVDVTVFSGLVLIPDPLNPAEPVSGLGSVPYEYLIDRFEVTNRQYAAFLNAVAHASDPFLLYNDLMNTQNAGGITRTGVAGNFIYTAKAGRERWPVVWMSFFDAVRYVNWLHNGAVKGGSTETGAYTLLGGTPIPSNADTVTREPDARFYIPSMDEWYKAGYYQPVAEGGDIDNYWLYATGGNVLPTATTPPGVDPSANYNLLGGTTADPLTEVGAYFTSGNYFVIYDMVGNVWELHDNITFNASFGFGRSAHGGGYNNTAAGIEAPTGVFYWGPDWEGSNYGFRIAASTSILGGGGSAVNAGADIEVTPSVFPVVETLNGSVDPPSPSVTWSQLSGPGTVVFGDANALSTTADFPAYGTYILKLTNNDDGSSDTMTVQVLISFANSIMPIFGTGEANCTQCHNSSNALNLNQSTALVHDEILATGASSGETVRAISGDPANSLILTKPQNLVPHGGGDRRIAVPPFTQAHIDAIELWIQQGVREN